MDGHDTRPAYLGSRAMVLNGFAHGVFAAALFLPARALTHRGSFAVGGSWLSNVFPAAVALAAVAVLAAWCRAVKALRGRGRGKSMSGERACVMPLASADAFDAGLRALAGVPGARIDGTATSVATGVLVATTRWRWLLGNGERIEVRLFELDTDHVAVSASSYPIYRGTWGDHARDERNLARLFAALPADAPSSSRSAPSY